MATPEPAPEPSAAKQDARDKQETPQESAAESMAEAETITVPVAELETLKTQLSDWKDRCLRSQAEFDNARKRLRKEADEAGNRAIARFVKPFLNELDNLERAITAAQPDAFADFAAGVSMIRDNLHTALTNAGLEQVPCVGVFDPAIHEVLAETETADQARGTIMQIHRAGYRLKDQLVRAAQVVVAKPPVAG